jgi:predicted ATPase/DNA-binding winged helix-turn-helix (wHTH) protein
VSTREKPSQERERSEPGSPSVASVVPLRGTQDEADCSPVRPDTRRARIASFGPFRLHITERLLEKNNQPVKLGSRALDILITLVERAPEVVTKRELIRRVWGELVVGPVNLRVHVASLRKALAEGESPSGHVTNVPGRGYCFASLVNWTTSAATPRSAPAGAPPLPRGPLLMVGRDGAVGELTRRLTKQRFVSIVGAGGIGKTTVALALAHQMQSQFQGAVHFLDLTAVEDPRLVANMLASQLGLVAVSDQPLPLILGFLREQRMLLVFDSCEHVIAVVAALTENIFRETPQVHILATSREALRVEGEQVHHLAPLACPPASVGSLTAAEALGYPAVQLFVKQVASRGNAFELTDADAPIVAEICRRLDGIPLALELTASRVGVYGVQGTASLLDKHFRLLWRGRRTAVPRHQTLSATLDWSYHLLSGTEQLILRRLAVFAGGFSLEAALDVTAESLDAAELTETVATLIEKSLVTSDSTSATRHRLLDTTRAYAWQKLTESGESTNIARRHCEHIVRALEQLRGSISTASSPEKVAIFVADLGNVRAALEWCFSDQGDAALRAQLAAASACHFFELNLLTECVNWTERAIRALDTLSKGTRFELELQACLALSLMVTKGNVEAVHTALVRALELAERLADASMRLLALDALYRWHVRSGDFRRLEELTNRTEIVTEQVSDPAAAAIARTMAFWTCFYVGDIRKEPTLGRIALAAIPIQSSRLNLASFGHSYRCTIHPVLARSLWLLGYPEQAQAAAEEALNADAALNKPVTHCLVLIPCVIVSLETGDWQKAEELTQRLSDCATKHGLLTYARAAIALQGHLAVSRGDPLRGIELLRTALAALHEDGYELYRPTFSAALAEGLAKAGKYEAAYSTVCEAIQWAENHRRPRELVWLLRVKGEILSLMSPSETSEGETYLLESLLLARQQGLLSLELRSGISLAKLWAERGAAIKALELLGPIFSRFSEGFQTRDLMAAAELLDELRSRG